MRKWNRVLALGLSAVFWVGSIGGCGSTATQSGSNETTQTNNAATQNASTDDTTSDHTTADNAPDEDTAPVGEDTLDLTIRTSAEVSSMDGSIMVNGDTMTVYGKTVEGLYKYSPTGELVPGLAESVDISEDGLTYTFHIRDAVWNNGTPVTANDFEFSWKRLANPETGAEYASMLNAAGIKNGYAVAYEGADLDSLGVKAVDDKTLVVELERPVAYFPSLLVGTYFKPINQEFYEAQGDQYGLTKDNVLACGPYVLTDWTPGGTVAVVTKNDSYYNADDITVDSITYQVIKDSQQSIMAWESGEIDNVSITGDLVELYQNDPAYKSVKSSTIWYFAVNEEVPGLENKNLRLALALSYDKQSICDNILKNGSIPAIFAIPEDFARDHNGKYFRDVANATYLESNKELALEYYNAAREELGQDTFTFELLYDDAEDTKSIAQFVQSEIQNTLPGVTLELKVQPKNNRTELMKNHEFDIGLTRWGADYQDATTYLDMWLTNSGLNYGNYSNPEYDKLVLDASGEVAADLDARLSNLIEAEQVILEDAGILPVYQVSSAYLVNPDINVTYAVPGGFLWEYATRK